VGSAFLFGDEFHSLFDMHGGLWHAASTFSDKGSGMALPLLQSALFELFGASHWSIRAPAYLAGLATLFLTYPLARRMVGSAAAIVATLLVAANPLLIFYSHFARAYSIVALLSLLLLDRLDRVVEGAPADRRAFIWLVIVTALLPYAHPTSLGLVLPVYAGAIVAVRRGPEGRGRTRWLMGALATAGLICVALHAPAWESLLAFVSAKTSTMYYGDFGLLDVATLLTGNRLAAWTGMVIVLAAIVALLRERGARALPLGMACAGPGITIALVAPYGDAYAYARYVLPCVVPICILIGWGTSALARRVWQGDDPTNGSIDTASHDDSHISASTSVAAATRDRTTLAMGIVLAGTMLIAGSQGSRRTDHGPHANTYLELLPLAAFDRPWADAPAFYHEIAGWPAEEREAIRIIESPALVTRTRHLYRSYQLLHGTQTLLAPFPEEFPLIVEGPYVSLTSPAWLDKARADYLVLHLDIRREVLRYWKTVYQPEDGVPTDAATRSYLERHAQFGGLLESAPPGWARVLTARFGEPIHQDEMIAVWALNEQARERYLQRRPKASSMTSE
jgi:hypothetical protein